MGKSCSLGAKTMGSHVPAGTQRTIGLLLSNLEHYWAITGTNHRFSWRRRAYRPTWHGHQFRAERNHLRGPRRFTHQCRHHWCGAVLHSGENLGVGQAVHEWCQTWLLPCSQLPFWVVTNHCWYGFYWLCRCLNQFWEGPWLCPQMVYPAYETHLKQHYPLFVIN